jgi:hemerythrin
MIDKKDLITGIPLIDQQHEKYAELVNRVFNEATHEGMSRETLEREVDNVVSYAVEHFDAEEYLMRSSKYPHYEEHRMKHNEFREQTSTLVEDMGEDLVVDMYIAHLSRWLVEWFCTQVENDDRKLAAFLQKKKD